MIIQSSAPLYPHDWLSPCVCVCVCGSLFSEEAFLSLQYSFHMAQKYHLEANLVPRYLHKVESY